MALFLNGRALCRGLIPLSGPRGTIEMSVTNTNHVLRFQQLLIRQLSFLVSNLSYLTMKECSPTHTATQTA